MAKYDDIRIIKVKTLGDRARETADRMGFKEDDLVIVRTRFSPSSILPTYDLEKIEGGPIEYLQRKFRDFADEMR